MRWHRRLTVLCAGGTRLAPTETECRPTQHMKNQASDMAGYLFFTVLVCIFIHNNYCILNSALTEDSIGFAVKSERLDPHRKKERIGKPAFPFRAERKKIPMYTKLLHRYFSIKFRNPADSKSCASRHY